MTLIERRILGSIAAGAIACALGSCGSGNVSSSISTHQDYDLRLTLRQLYGQNRSWSLRGNACCAGGSMTASIKNIPIADIDNGMFDLNGRKLDGTSVVIEGNTSIGTRTARFRTGTTTYFSPSSMQAQMAVNASEKLMELTTSEGELPQSARVGDVGDAGTSTIYANYPDDPHAIATAHTTWEIKQAKNRVLFCMNRVTTPVTSGPTETASRCHQINDDSGLSSYASLSLRSANGTGYELASD